MQVRLHGFSEKGPGILKVGNGHHGDDASNQLGPTIYNARWMNQIRVSDGCHRCTSSVSRPTLGTYLQIASSRTARDQFPQRCTMQTLRSPPAYLRGWVVCLHLLLKWDHTGNQPLSPHFIDLTLEVIDIIVGKVREPSLL